MADESYVQLVVRELRRQKDLADRAMAQVDDDAFFATLAADDNSIAVIVKHVAGNMRSRWRDFLTTDGEKPDRDRDSEFDLTSADTRESLLRRWDAGWRLVFDAIGALSAGDLDRSVTIRGEQFTVLQAINRQLTHYSYHVGQAVLLARHHAGGEWKSLSIPRGQSAAFNEKPGRYPAADAPSPRRAYRGAAE
ncbi:MAG TPA: DUF1572 family protein [Thermoanaerobaculia bacterium]|jgi:hypothetical protein